MSHDKIKAAARERMARTGEPYATARREVVAEIRAAAAAHEELGPEYSDAVVASFLNRVEEEITARVEARLGDGGRAGLGRPQPPAASENHRTLLRGMAIGLAISAFAMIVVGGNGAERLHRTVLVMLIAAVTLAVVYVVSQARGAPRRPVAPSARADRTAR